MYKNKVFLFGFWGMEVMYYHMIRIAKEKKINIDWTILLLTDHHYKLLVDLLGKDKVLLLDRSISRVRKVNFKDIEYVGNLHADIECEKRTFKHRAAEQQKNIALKIYHQIFDFADKHKPTHFLASRVEGFEGKAFISVAKLKGAKVIVPTHLRNIDGWFFSPDDRESLPNYYGEFSKKDREQAIVLLENNNKNPLKSFQIGRDESLLYDKIDPRLDDFKAGNFKRITKGIKLLLDGSNPIEFGTIRYIFLMNFPWIRDSIWWIRKNIAIRNYDIENINDLPAKYIYYPIQYSPESSINNPAPYYVDQTRAIDAIRFSMPSDYVLVLKEHPSCMEVRPLSFIKNLRKKSGVIVVKSTADNIKLVKNAGITISVTGTATFEAFMLGKPSINLGRCFISAMYNGITTIDELKYKIIDLLGKEIPKETVIETIAKLVNIRKEFVYCQPGIAGEPLLRKKNIENILNGLLEHISYNEKDNN